MMMRSTRTTRRTLLAIAILSSCAFGAGTVTNPNAEVIEIRKIEVDPLTGLVTLRWSSQAGSTYAIEETANPKFGWQERVNKVSGDPLETTFSLLPQASNYGAKTMLFRVRKMEKSEDGTNDLQAASTDKASSMSTTKSGVQNAAADTKLQVVETASNTLATRAKFPASLDRFILT